MYLHVRHIAIPPIRNHGATDRHQNEPSGK
ncbi:hypothetical protein KMAL_32190 [Novacetimonas maltaceti]|uniref:Uncharacterized protein n=1 Tax=Novacetimonas maltaceti TaxID=1203393 RepID=A0A2S3VXZ5_9PROT|nr:hypothetical protein KMAL_32190 [Novacetimonas maltaceti]